jgi:hypothetical protein
MKKLSLLILLFSFAIGWSQKNQNEEIAGMKDGSYQVYKPIAKGRDGYVMQLAKKPWPVSFYREGEIVNKILIKRVGLIDEFYTVDLPNYPAYYNGGNGDVDITVIDGKIYYYHYSVKTGATIDYVLSMSKVISYDHEKGLLDEYRKKMKIEQGSARTERKEENAELARIEAEENTLKGKSIQSIEIKLAKEDQEAGLISMVEIGMVVTLKNGKVLKTKNLGGKTPYEDFGTKSVSGEYAGGYFKIAADINDIVDHKLKLTVWSKYDESKKDDFIMPLNYKSTIAYWFLGAAGGYNGANGSNGRDGHDIGMTVYGDVINGFDVYRINMMDYSNGRSVSSIINKESTITINTSGGKGGAGSNHSNGNGGDGGDGGNGGNITVSGSGAQTIKIDALKSGGEGGRAGSGESGGSRGYSGRSGSSGNLTRN